MKLIKEPECYSKMSSAKYGFDAYGNEVEAPEGYEVLIGGIKLEESDRPFDVYSGWLPVGHVNTRYTFRAQSEGRWTTFARKAIHTF